MTEKQTLCNDPYARSEYEEYFKLFSGKSARHSVIERDNNMMVFTVNQLLKSGEIVGQRTFLSEEALPNSDVIYYCPKLFNARNR